MPDFRSAAVCADRFADRQFLVVYTSAQNGQRCVMPPGRVAGTYTFPQAVRVALDVLARTPDWTAGDPPRIVSVDGLAAVSVSALEVLDVGRVARLLAAVAGQELALELPPVRVALPDEGEDDD